MNDQFLHGLREQPTLGFATALKAKLDLRAAALATRRRFVYLMSSLVIAGTALAFVSPSIIKFVVARGSEPSSVQPSVRAPMERPATMPSDIAPHLTTPFTLPAPTAAGSDQRSLSTTAHAPTEDSSAHSPALRAVPESTARKPNEVEVCGVGMVEIELDDDRNVGKHIQSLIQPHVPRWSAMLQRSKDVRAQAVGLAFQAQLAVRETVEVVSKQAGPCDALDASCLGSLRIAQSEAIKRGAPELIERLADLAMSAQDPAVFAMAADVCGLYQGTPPGGACRSLSIKQWAFIDQRNAAPWLLLAHMASRRRDVAAEVDALEHAAMADTVNFYGDSLYASTISSLPSDISPLVRTLMMNELILVYAVRAKPKEYAVQHCQTPEVDRKRYDICSSLAELFVNNGTDLRDFDFGIAMGKPLGWSSERINTLTQERNALVQAATEVSGWASPRPANLFSCYTAQRYNQYLDKMVALGERGAARDAVTRLNSKNGK